MLLGNSPTRADSKHFLAGFFLAPSIKLLFLNLQSRKGKESINCLLIIECSDFYLLIYSVTVIFTINQYFASIFECFREEHSIETSIVDCFPTLAAYIAIFVKQKFSPLFFLV